MTILTSYLDRALDPERREVVIYRATQILRHVQFDTIAFMGLSGALIAPIVAYKMEKGVLAVRKDLGGHSPLLVEGNIGSQKYVIIDDFTSTGETVYLIRKRIHAVAPEAECVGIYEYFNHGFNAYWLDKTSPVSAPPVGVPL